MCSRLQVIAMTTFDVIIDLIMIIVIHRRRYTLHLLKDSEICTSLVDLPLISSPEQIFL